MQIGRQSDHRRDVPIWRGLQASRRPQSEKTEGKPKQFHIFGKVSSIMSANGLSIMPANVASVTID
jgi:hypothetical protein